ncbi:gephyrin-like molybdotransferase Glp [Pseudoxanthomonas sp. UTMC 1351]|uniref:molybdopterin molybdotransferase MoeA n=1 Tax=Pseudoxanthomonas sp. UTMC 1351 TaxID=2695853 RepID=UPI0034CD5E37
MSEFPTRIAYEEALAIVRRVADEWRLAHERIATQRADGRILAEPIQAPISLPPFDNSRMDGFALRHADIQRTNAQMDSSIRLRIVGEQFAGYDTGLRIGAGECARITTGAPLPAGADTVVIKENVREHDGAIDLEVVPDAGADIRRAGEDVAAGDTVLQAGQVLTPARLSLIAALGIADLMVFRRPTVAVFTTGDELVEPGLPLAPGQIYNSNRELLMGLLRAQGLEPTAWPSLPDDPARIESQLRDAASAFDVVITCGGVSAGEKDLLPAMLSTHGQTHFWKVRMKPGMPVLFGTLERAAFLGLPGNPVSVLATFSRLGRALLNGMQGRAEPHSPWFAALAVGWDKTHDRHEFLRGRLSCGQDGRLSVTPHPADASHRLKGAADSDVLIVLPEGARNYLSGDVVEVVGY